jgi:hypothetical protein
MDFQQVYAEAAKLHNKGDLQRACQIYDRLLAQKPDYGHLLYAYGTALSQSQMFGLAINMLRQAVGKDPNNHEAWHNLGLSYRTMGMLDEAIGAYQVVLTKNLTPVEKCALYGNLSGCYVNEGNPAKAVELADLGLAIQDKPQLRNHKALALLELGRYEEGFKLYEARFELPEFTKRDFGDVPRWDGKPTKSLAIHGEQGLGDELLFLTCLKKVLPLCEEVHIECAVRLLGLLKHSFRNEPKVKLYPSHGELIGRCKPTAWTAMGSLPAHMWPFEPWTFLESSRTFKKEGKRVGLSWRGGTLKTHEYYRNAPLEMWKPLISDLRSKAEVISVQYGDAAPMAKHLELPHDEANISDLDSLAGMLKSCDLVISVCNTTIHMCGALGVPCIVLVPDKPAWRYGLTGDKSDWYESVEYVRKAKDEPWESVMWRLREKVRAWS